MVIFTEDKSIHLQTLDAGAMWASAYLVTCPETNESVLIDAPGKPEKLLEQVRNKNVKYILMTHNHSDHIGALQVVHAELKIPVGGHAADAPKYPVALALELNDGDTLTCGQNQIRVLHTPGHTDGSLCFLIGKHLFVGDTLFPGGPGYTASPDDFEEIVSSITRKLFSLPDDTIVYPGHGASTILGKEKDAYKAFAARTHNTRLSGDVLWLKS
ncbi:MAG: MBL fold metallo-hydrolase [Dehalococcoidales bacterium]|nr:MBL fold metallo-hydrolase [Dehalococcoidales bacterium]